PTSALLPPPSDPTPADFVVFESTYGGKIHPASNVLDELADVVLETIRQKGNLLIPSFAVGRAQELMYLLNLLKTTNRIPKFPIFLDSPMGANATSVFKRYPAWHKLTQQQCDSTFESVTIVSDFADTLSV